MNLLILDAGHSFDTKGKNNLKENFYEWEFNNDMQYKIKSRCEELGITVFLCLDYLIPSISFMLSTFIAGFLFKEALSIIENLIRLDVYIPNSIKKMLEVGVEKIENKEIK